MNNRFKLLLIIQAALLIVSCASKPVGDLSAQTTEQSEVRVYEVFGMDCPGCHGGLEKQLNAIKGVLDTEADWTKKQVKVVVDTSIEVSDDSIFEGMKRANFTPGKRLR